MYTTIFVKLLFAALDLYARTVHQAPSFDPAEIKSLPPIVQDKLDHKNAMNAELGPWTSDNITVFVNESFEVAAAPRDYFAYHYIAVADIAVAGNEMLRPAYNAQFNAFQETPPQLSL